MKTSWNNTQQIEAHLLGEQEPMERLLFEAKLLVNPLLRTQYHFQKKVYTLLKHYHRKQVKEELQLIEEDLLKNPHYKEFQQEITQLFNP